MKIIKVEPKDVHVTIEFSLNEICMILNALDHAKIDVTDKSDDVKKAAKFLTDEFFETLNKLHESISEEE